MKFFEQVKAKIDEAKNGDGFLQLPNQGFNDEDIKELLQLLAAVESITQLNLSHNSIGSEGAKLIATLNFITSLDLSHNNVGDEAVRSLCCESKIKELDLTCNNIGNTGAETMTECATQKILLIANNNISPEMEIKVSQRIESI